jgi:hypothetical protein
MLLKAGLINRARAATGRQEYQQMCSISTKVQVPTVPGLADPRAVRKDICKFN